MELLVQTIPMWPSFETPAFGELLRTRAECAEKFNTLMVRSASSARLEP
jgi:hypothetical protein